MHQNPDDLLDAKPHILVLPERGGAPFALTIPAAMLRFIGAYPRLPEMAPPGRLLDYQAAA